MPTNIEELTTRVEDTKNQIEQSEGLSQAEKLEKAKDLESVIYAIKSDLDGLKKDSTDEVLTEIDALESKIINLNNKFELVFKSQLDELENEIKQKTNTDIEKKEDNKEPTEKEKGWLGKQFEGLTSKDEWKNHTGKNIARVAGGIGVVRLGSKLIKGIGSLFSSKDKTKETEDKPWYKKWWGMGALGLGGVLARKNRDNIKDKFNDIWNWITLKNDPETTPGDGKVGSGSFENLSEEEKEKYLEFSDDMFDFGRSYPGYFDVSLSDDVDKDKKLKGTMIHTLDKNIGNLGNFGNKEMLDFMYQQSTDDFLDKLGNWTKEKAYSYLGPYLESIESFKPFGQKFISDPVGAIREWLQGGENHEEQLQAFLKYNLNIFNYVTEKRIILKERVAKEQVMGNSRLKEEPNESEQDQIDTFLSDEQWNNSTFLPLLSKYNLSNLGSLLDKYTIEVVDISKESEKLNESFQEDKIDAFAIDDDNETCISRAKTELLDGNLSEQSKEDLTHLCEWLLDDISGSGNTGNKNFLNAYTHLITDIFGGSESSAEQLIETLKLGELDESIKNTLSNFVNKLENNNFAQTDLDDLEQKANGYFNLKESIEKTMQSAQHYNSGGIDFDWQKALMLPINAIKDVGKIFDGDNSWQERIGSGLGGLYISGQTLYIYSKTGLAGSSIAEFAGKGAIKIGQLPVTLGQETLRIATGRRFLAGYSWSEYIKNPALTSAEKNRMLRYAFIRGEISEARALRIAESIGGTTINNINDLLKSFGLTDPAHQEMFIRYGKNKNVRDLLFSTEKAKAHSIKTKVKYNFTKRTLARDMVPNINAFKKLTTIHNNIKLLDEESQIFRNQFLKNTKTLDKVDDVIANVNTRQLIQSLGKNSTNILRYSKALAKNFHKFDSVDDFHKYIEFLNRQKGAIADFDVFVANTAGKGKDIIKMTTTEQSTLAKSSKLNRSFLGKRINRMKDHFRKTSETLKKVASKSPYKNNVLSQSEKFKVLSNMDDETFKVMQNVDAGLSKQKWISSMTSHSGFLDETYNLMKSNKEFAKAISKAKTPQAVKEVFSKFGQKVPNNVPEEFFGNLAKTKNTTKIMDNIKYVQKYESLNKITKILKNPTMKYAGRIIGRTFAIGTVALGGFMAYNTYQEGSEIAKTNKERGESKQQEAYFDVALALAGACAFVPGVGRVAGAAIIGVTAAGGYLKESVYGTIDKFTKNYKDFLSDSPLLIKQHIITTNLGQQGVDRAFSETIGRTFSGKDFDHLTKKTGSEAIRALLYIDEWKDNPLAMINIQDSELMNKLSNETPPITYDMVAQAVKQAESNVNKRYNFLKSNLGTIESKDDNGNTIQILDTSKYITSSKVSKGGGILAIDQLLMLSKYNVQDPDKFPNTEVLTGDANGLLSKLKTNEDSFNKLESLFAKDKRTLAYMYRHSITLEQHMNEFAIDDNGDNTESQYDQIINNKNYLNDYMVYKSLMTGIDLSSLVYQQNQTPNLISVREFLLDFKDTKPLSSAEILLSTNKFQNAMYRIAVEVFGVQDIKNTPKDLLYVFSEANEKSYGIYFKNGDINRLCVNGNSFSDSEYSLTDSDLSKFKDDINKKVNNDDLIDIGTGDQILNKEIGTRYMKILNEEINRI